MVLINTNKHNSITIGEYSSIVATGAVENFDETYNEMIKATEDAGLRRI